MQSNYFFNQLCAALFLTYLLEYLAARINSTVNFANTTDAED